MTLLEKKYNDAVRSLKTLEEAPAVECLPLVRDATIQRFEYSGEAFWKFLEGYLRIEEGIVVASPKTTIKEATKVGILERGESVFLIEMIDDRNTTTHLYHEETPQRLYEKIQGYAKSMSIILQRFAALSNETPDTTNEQTEEK